MSTKSLLRAPEQKVLEAAKTALLVARGKSKLAGYGMNEQYFSKCEADILTASGFKTDEELSKELRSITNQKNSKLIEAIKWGEAVKLRLELAFPDNHEVAEEFPTNFSKARKSETLMLEVIPNINNLIDKYAAKLKEKGLADDHKQKGTAIAQQLDELNKQQETMKKTHPQYTVERIAAYQKLYDMVNEINKTGRTAYADSAADLKVFQSPWQTSEKKDAKEAEIKPQQ